MNIAYKSQAVYALKRRFNEWDIWKRTATVLSDELKRRIQVLFFEIGLDDKEMLQVL